jgi:hypothetical protein
MASYEDSQFAFDILPKDEKLSTIYAEIFKVTTTLRDVSERLVALENLAFSPAPTLPPSVAAVSTGRAKSKKGKQKVAPPPTPSTGRSLAPPIAIQSVSTKAALEKTVVTLQIQEAQAGHLVGRTGNGLREVHDFSRAKVSVAPATGNTGLRPVTIRGSIREVGDALTAIGKRLARRQVRNPRAKKGKNKSAIPPAPAPVSPYVSVVPPPPSSWDGPPTPQVVVQPPTPSPSGGPYSSSLELPPPFPHAAQYACSSFGKCHALPYAVEYSLSCSLCSIPRDAHGGGRPSGSSSIASADFAPRCRRRSCCSTACSFIGWVWSTGWWWAADRTSWPRSRSLKPSRRVDDP